MEPGIANASSNDLDSPAAVSLASNRERERAALLHAGAKGYLARHPAQRRLREAYFIAIVTPALKHLRQELARPA